jgi:hypothetical protein
VCTIYFPSTLRLEYDGELETRLAQDLRDWLFLKFIDPPIAQLGLHMSRFCSVESPLGYERRVLLHRHLTWIFYMDRVSERLALHDLHATAGKIYLDNLKNIMRDGQVTDMTESRGSCPDTLIDNALSAS